MNTENISPGSFLIHTIILARIGDFPYIYLFPCLHIYLFPAILETCKNYIYPILTT